MYKIFFASRVRGFFKHLFSDPDINFNFNYGETSIYEVNSRMHSFLSWCIRSKVCDWLGMIQSIKAKNTGCDIHGSYNRFLNSDRPYFIYVENPTALYHYRLNRVKSILGKRKITNALNDEKLSALVFMSKACADTFDDVCGKTTNRCLRRIIYPLIPINKYVSEAQIRSKRNHHTVRLLYIAQGIRFFSKGALEILEVYARLCQAGADCTLTMVTNISDIKPEIIKKIKNIRGGVRLYDFKFSYAEMERLYADHDILLQPSSDDSCPMTILEAMHSGLPIVASRLYAIPEMVKNGINGFLVEPAYYFFSQDNYPNPAVWNHRKKTIYAGKCSEKLVVALYEKLRILISNRDLLEKMSLQSYQMASNEPFSRRYIVDQWNNLLSQISTNRV